MGLSEVVRAEPKIETFRTFLNGANMVKARLISSIAELAILMSKEDDGPFTRSVIVFIDRFNCRTSDGVRSVVSKLFSKSSIALRVFEETFTWLRNPDSFIL
jgi:SH3-like domain-containing protein